MNALGRLKFVRATLVAAALLRALAWGAVAMLSVLALTAGADAFTPLSLAARSAMLSVAVGGAGATAVALAWRDRGALSLARVALWIEEHHPQLEYRLVTAVETGNDGLLRRVDAASWGKVAVRGAARVIGAPALIIVAAWLMVVLLPAGAVARVRAPHAGDSLERNRPRGTSESRLTPLVAEVTPPAYSGEPRTRTDEPTDVRALVGGTLMLTGRGAAAGITAQIGIDSVRATGENDRWSITLRVPERPLAIRLVDGGHERIVALEPLADNPPIVTLEAPAHDSVLRAPRGRIALAADATDDFGIATANFEYIVSSGEGENFTFKSGTIGSVPPNVRRASMSASLSLDSLGLKPGDIVHLRAVARDANTVSGPGTGVSETRAIRIARAGEYDSVAVEAAAPSEADKSMISERMLIMLAEALEKKRSSLRRDTLVQESRGIASEQKRLRRGVGDLVFMRLGGTPSGEEHTDENAPARARSMEEMLARADSATNRSTDPIDFAEGESPVVSTNKPLLEAYNAMWNASTELEVGEPGRALPHMRLALAAIQRARQAERVYLRGAPPIVVIDIERARLKGKDKGVSSTRRVLTSGDTAVRRRMERFSRIVDASRRDPAAAVDSLLLLRIDALNDAPVFAAALDDAVTAMRRGRSDAADAALARARRLLSGVPIVRDSLTRWRFVP